MLARYLKYQRNCCLEDKLMGDSSGYKIFQDKIFREITDLDAEHDKFSLLNAVREYGLTWDEACKLYFRPGMNGQQFLEAMKADREK
jgi:hypothetical protein